MSNVLKFEPQSAPANFRLDPDDVLEQAKGLNFDRMVILGQLPDGSVYYSGNANAGETLVMMELAKHQIVHGDE